jgi:predicted ATPase
VLFIDDLQWADVSSLRLLESLGTAPRMGLPHRLMLICGFRPNDIASAQMASRLLAALRSRSSFAVTDMQLGPLSLASTAALLGDWLRLPASHAALQRLADFVQSKSEGVPFCVLQVLYTLYSSGAVSLAEGAVHVDFVRAATGEFSGAAGIAAVLGPRIRGLPKAVQQLMGIAACIGREFT